MHFYLMRYNYLQSFLLIALVHVVLKLCSGQCSKSKNKQWDLHANSPLSAKLREKLSAPIIYQYLQSPFSSELSHFFLRGHFTDGQKINSADCGGFGVFSIFPPRTFYRRSEDKLRGLRRFSSEELGGNKIAAIVDFSIKLHLAWQCLFSSVKTVQ